MSAPAFGADFFSCSVFFESASKGNLENLENLRFHLSRLGYNAEVLLPQTPALAPQAMTKTQIVKVYDLTHGYSATGWRRFAFLKKSAEDESRRHVEMGFLTQRLYPALSRQWHQKSNSSIHEVWKSRFEYALTATIDILTYKANSLLYLYPYRSPSRLWKIKSDVFDYYQTHDWDSTYQHFHRELKTLGITDVVWRKGRQLYAVFIAGVLIHYSSFLTPYMSMMTSLHQVTPTAMAKFEQRTYDSEAIIQDQFAKWLESLDRVPTEAEKQTQLQKIRRFEARGVFRIYSKPAEP